MTRVWVITTVPTQSGETAERQTLLFDDEDMFINFLTITVRDKEKYKGEK